MYIYLYFNFSFILSNISSTIIKKILSYTKNMKENYKALLPLLHIKN